MTRSASIAIALVATLAAGCSQTGGSTDRSAIEAQVTRYAIQHGVPPEIAHRVVRYESGYRPQARGKAGEYGLGQIKCATARGIGFAGPCEALLDPAVNLDWSMRYLRLALDRGGVEFYNAGVHARRVPAAALTYARAVMGGR